MNMAPIILPLIIQGQGWKDFTNHEVKTLILQEGELAPEWESKWQVAKPVNSLVGHGQNPLFFSWHTLLLFFQEPPSHL